MKKIVTHNSSFHTDDIFAVATLLLVEPEARVVRSREKEEIKSADYVIDVGMVYDPSTNRFDHHQLGGAGVRKNGIPYASFGLVWKEFGERLSGGKREAEIIDSFLIQSIDAHDNGVATSESKFGGVKEYSIGDFFSSYLVDYDIDADGIYKIFMGNVDIAKNLLTREVKRAKAMALGENIFKDCYEQSKDKRLIEVPKEGLPWDSIAGRFPEPLYVVYPRRDGNWSIKAVSDITKPYGYQRKALPKEWAAKRDEELQKVTGVADALFCHSKRFMASAGSKEGALKLAEVALNA